MTAGVAANGSWRVIDGYRGLAVLVVVVCHVAILLLPRDAPTVISLLHLIALPPVILLFVMSGFLIGSSVKRQAERNAFGIRQYALARVARIYPGFLLSIGIVWLIAWVNARGWLNGHEASLIGTYAMTPVAFARDVLFLFGKNTPTQNINGPVWSLRFEVIFYVLMGLAMLARSRTGRLRWGAAITAAALTVISLMWLQDAWMALAAFGAGVICAYRPDLVGRLRDLPAWLAVLAFAALQYGFATGFVQPQSALGALSKNGLYAALILASVSAMARGGQEPRPAQVWLAAFAPLASSSYTLYVIHYPVLILAIGIIAPPDGVVARVMYGVCLLALALASAFYAAKLTEQRDLFRDWLDRIVPGGQRKT